MTREHAYKLRVMIEKLSTAVADADAVKAVELFPVWKSGNEYIAGDRVRHNGVLYKCLTSHAANVTWNPPSTPSLWAEVLAGQGGTEIGEWVQPDSTNPYMRGDRVTYNGKTYESTVDNNVWMPGVYGWVEI